MIPSLSPPRIAFFTCNSFVTITRSCTNVMIRMPCRYTRPVRFVAVRLHPEAAIVEEKPLLSLQLCETRVCPSQRNWVSADRSSTNTSTVTRAQYNEKSRRRTSRKLSFNPFRSVLRLIWKEIVSYSTQSNYYLLVGLFNTFFWWNFHRRLSLFPRSWFSKLLC